MSEFGTAWVLAKLYYGHHKPFILFGDFWHEIIEAVKKGMLIDEHELVSYYTLEKIETLIKRSSLDSIEMYKILGHIKYEKDALEFYNFLQQNQLIPGIHYTPHTIDEQGYAIRFMVYKDDLHELRWNTTKK